MIFLVSLFLCYTGRSLGPNMTRLHNIRRMVGVGYHHYLKTSSNGRVSAKQESQTSLTTLVA
jgi:hypothetical protein